MANFNEAFDKTMGHEGGYSNDGVDKGGETYRGISRRFHPDWEGWLPIDWWKEKHGKEILDDPRLKEELDPDVRAFYKSFYWNPMALDECPSQAVANEMFDTAVNMGLARAVTFLQRSLNVMNKNGSLFADLVEDGNLGPKTVNALSIVLAFENGAHILLVWMNVCQGQHYMEYMKKSPEQERFAWGWAKRLKVNP